MMSRLVIEAADNGFIARYDDPDIIAQNRAEDSVWNDPERQVVFPDMDTLQEALPDLIEKVQQAAVAEAQERAKDFTGGFKITAEAGG